MHALKPNLLGYKCTIKHAFSHIFIRIQVEYTVQYIDTKILFEFKYIYGQKACFMVHLFPSTWVLMHASQYKGLRYSKSYINPQISKQSNKNLVCLRLALGAPYLN